MSMWRFFIDVGGTFTDVVACQSEPRAPATGALRTYKLLSSGCIRGVAESGSKARCLVDSRRVGEADDLWVGYRVRGPAFSASHEEAPRVTSFDGKTGRLTLDSAYDSRAVEYELYSGEEAPVVAIRMLMGIGLGEPIGAGEVRPGGDRPSNAQRARRGARGGVAGPGCLIARPQTHQMGLSR